jgi:hypothetical protein
LRNGLVPFVLKGAYDSSAILILSLLLSVVSPICLAQASQTFRDDFNYTTVSDLQNAGWSLFRPTDPLSAWSLVSVGSSSVTLTNNGNQGTGIKRGELPSGTEWSVETAAKWVAGSYATIGLYVNVTNHRYKFWLDGYYSSFEFDRDGDVVLRQTISQLQPQMWYTMKMNSTIYGSFIELYLSGKAVFAYQETDPHPGSLTTLGIEPGRESTISFDYVLVTAQELTVTASTYGYTESSILLATSQESTASESTSSHVESLTGQTVPVSGVSSLSITDIFTILGSLATLIGTATTLILVARSRRSSKKKRVSIAKDKTKEHTSDEKGSDHMNYEYDVFICHATEDKREIAEPLARLLTNKGLKVWYDEFTLKVGDSLRQKIDYGLAHSRYGVVILSEFFFKKNWPQRELDGLAAREDSEGHKVILPVWHHVDRDYVVKYSPTLADRLASKSSDGLDIVLKELLDVIMEPVPPSGLPEPPDSVRKTTAGIDIDNDMRLMFHEYAERLTPSHLKVLEFLDNPHEYGERHSVRFGSYMAGGVSTILEEAIPELKGRRGFYDQLVRDLHTRGLINIDQNGIHVMMTQSGMFASRTTEEGKKFLIFIAERRNRNADS